MVVNESSQFREIGFEIEKTKDESPTLRLLNGSERGGESMHHTGGAFSETKLIYGQAFDWGFQRHANPQIISLGLGLGYVEVLAAVYSLLHNSSDWTLLSFETVEGLQKKFIDFYYEDQESETYQWILNKMAGAFDLSPEKIKGEVQRALEEKRLLLLGEFVANSHRIKEFDVFCYDAYSKKTSPELWDENFMTEVFKRGGVGSCISTYASNGALKRALQNSGFQFEVLEGFQGKRNRTWATK